MSERKPVLQKQEKHAFLHVRGTRNLQVRRGKILQNGVRKNHQEKKMQQKCAVHILDAF